MLSRIPSHYVALANEPKSQPEPGVINYSAFPSDVSSSGFPRAPLRRVKLDYSSCFVYTVLHLRRFQGDDPSIDGAKNFLVSPYALEVSLNWRLHE